MHVCTLHQKELAAVRYQSRIVASALSPLRSTHFSPPGHPSKECVCLSCAFISNSYICAALCIAEAWDYQSHMKASVQPVFLDLTIPHFPNSSLPCSFLVPYRPE